MKFTQEEYCSTLSVCFGRRFCRAKNLVTINEDREMRFSAQDDPRLVISYSDCGRIGYAWEISYEGNFLGFISTEQFPYIADKTLLDFVCGNLGEIRLFERSYRKLTLLERFTDCICGVREDKRAITERTGKLIIADVCT